MTARRELNGASVTCCLMLANWREFPLAAGLVSSAPPEGDDAGHSYRQQPTMPEIPVPKQSMVEPPSGAAQPILFYLSDEHQVARYTNATDQHNPPHTYSRISPLE
jgi:hypothetical protein